MDLASRLRPLQSALRSRLSRADVLTEVIREVNASLDPERVADAIIARAAQWLPAPAWVVYAVDNAGVRTFVVCSGGVGTPSVDELSRVMSWSRN